MPLFLLCRNIALGVSEYALRHDRLVFIHGGSRFPEAGWFPGDLLGVLADFFRGYTRIPSSNWIFIIFIQDASDVLCAFSAILFLFISYLGHHDIAIDKGECTQGDQGSQCRACGNSIRPGH